MNLKMRKCLIINNCILRFMGRIAAVMRFVLADPEKRLFLAERFCFRGSVED